MYMKETNVELVVQTVVTLGITRCVMLSRKAFSLVSMYAETRDGS